MGFTNKIKAIKEWLKINQRIDPDAFVTKKKKNLLQGNAHTSSIAYFNNKAAKDSNKEIGENWENYYSIKFMEIQMNTVITLQTDSKKTGNSILQLRALVQVKNIK